LALRCKMLLTEENFSPRDYTKIGGDVVGRTGETARCRKRAKAKAPLLGAGGQVSTAG
jgi:hypothetical protein